jgi:HPt (histidine-containing phosphotransfer) domain-containing protein
MAGRLRGDKASLFQKQEKGMPMNSAARRGKEIRPIAGRETPIIDLVHLSRQTCGDGGLENELLRLFIVQAQQYAAWLEESSAPGDALHRADLTHRLKGSAQAIGAFPLAEAAEVYEETLRAGASDPGSEARRLAKALEDARLAAAQLL